MKKILYSVLSVAVVVLAASSCEKILDSNSPSAFDSATVYGNYSLTEGTIFGITESFCEVNSYRGRFLPWYGHNTDIEWYNTYKKGDGKSDISAYDCLPNNSQLNLSNGPFPLMYMGIERANLVIEGIREYGNPSERPEMAYLLGEALTLRAMIYYDLIKAWGDVPARFTPLTSETIYAPKESRDVIFKQILSDLEEAIPYIPNPGETAATSRTDRVNKVFAEGLYARIALLASGYALRPEDGAVGTGDLGTVRLSSDPELQKEVLYPKALNYLKAAYGKAALESDYEYYWYKQSNMDNLTAGPGSETLYVIPFGEGRGRWNYTYAIKSEGASITANTSRGGDVGPLPTVYFMYDEGDQRRDVTCVNYQWNKGDVIEPAGIGKWYFGKYRFEWMHAQPYTGGNDDGIKPVVMRYSDILLMAAEIENELNGPAGAKKYLEEVRARACGEDAAAAYVAALSTKEDFFEAVAKERALEFCGEFLRKADLIRWNRLKESLDAAKAQMNDLRDLAGDFAGLSGDIAYALSEDGQSLDIQFLAPGEKAPSGYELSAGYVNKYDDAKKTGFYAEKIEGIYAQDPVQHMFWPIFNDTMTNSQGYIKNDYGYDNL
ncbi:MAG TPA: RagB/SusD family nutrient uptake outer membrane protein [Rikenellaceae bacterium]|nr:RagB/SusD family nutrient uptake outer membrane protein [Rikenellaceae bacterium]